ncbi:MAG: phytanoyl-CoA dioxygenase family protein [Lentisphaerae bacterium]|nr:phytanoyl-CoA dioxygenase family protein [Lentisphaerota bacterium]
MNTTTAAPLVTEAMKQQYRDEGYMILERIIPADMLQMLREECSYFLGYYDSEMDMRRTKVDGINHRSKRYFISNRYHLSPRMWEFIFSPLMAEITQATLGPDVYLFNEQWVIKGAEQGMKFAWHQDSGYVGRQNPHKPYLTCWCTLDDVSEQNGTVYVLPHSRGGTRQTIFDHTQEPGSNDLIGYQGSDPGLPIIAPAGSIVAFTSYTFHRSGANTTSRMRRIYLPQYSGEPILNKDGSNWAMAVPFMKDGKRVYDRAGDTFDRHAPANLKRRLAAQQQN